MSSLTDVKWFGTLLAGAMLLLLAVGTAGADHYYFSVDLYEDLGLPGTGVDADGVTDLSHTYDSVHNGTNSRLYTDSTYGLSSEDDMDAVSDGRDLFGGVFFFSVEDGPGIEGVAGSAVENQSKTDGVPPLPIGSGAVQGDIFESRPGSNVLRYDEQQLGLYDGATKIPAVDDLDALEVGSWDSPGIYFSVDWGPQFNAAHLYTSVFDNTNSVWAYDVTMGLNNTSADWWSGETDNVDALVCWDEDAIEPWGASDVVPLADPTTDWAMFSLYPGSGSLSLPGNQFLWWGTGAAVGRSPTPGDVLITDFTNQFWLHTPYAALGLDADDNLDALDTTPEASLWTLLLCTFGVIGASRRRRTSGAV